MSSILPRHDVALAPGAAFEDRYAIVAKLAEGELGAVYKARQLSTGQPIALKVLRLPVHGDATRTARFLRETRLCAQLRHPHIVQLVDSGQAADGTLYIAFAFAPGDNLAALIEREGALAPHEARHLMLQVLDALACAHTGGVVHRDLKPSNILVIATGARRNAVVLDFGIGAVIDDERAAHATGGRDASGTPGYGAPEQWRSAEPSPRADLFAWGLVFLECLTGAPVYRGSAAEILFRLLGPDPVPLPAALERHPLGELIARAVRKDAATRDVTARGLLEALDACDLRGLSPSALVGGGTGAGPAIALPIASPAGGAAPAPPALDGERRQLTALCCRVVVHATGPAADAEALAEALDGALRAALVDCMSVGRRHGGCVAAVLGGDLLLYFGYPRAAEDDARHAARAARAIVGAVDAENQRLAARRVRAEVSAGLHSGPVVDGGLGDLAGVRLVAGATPRIAARLATLAAPGAVIASAASQALLRAAFDLEPAGAAEGIAPGTEVFRLGDERGAAPRSTSDDAGAPLAGRALELGVLIERWQRARQGSGQSSLLTGEPGIGKSRLARELRERIAQDAHGFLEARCSPDTRHSALAPVIDLLERALGLDQESGTSAKVARLERELAGHGAAPAAAMPLFLPLFSLPIAAPYAPLDVSGPRQKALTLQAIASLLFAMAERRPILLLVEDLHWADPTTMELLSQLVRDAPGAAMCLVMTARPEFSLPFSTAGVQLVPLGRLDRPQIAEMVSHLVDERPLPSAVIDDVADRADGVPLYVEELVRMMIDTGLLVEQGDRYELAGSLSSAAIPGTLRALLTARLDRLSRAKETARLAAALGREFSLEVLAAASPLGPEAVAEDLEQLVRARIVQRKRRGKDAVGVFKHALVRDAAYDSLSAGARQRVHARIANTLEDRFPEVVRTRPDLLAHHHAAAEQIQQAVTYGQRAAEQGLQRSTYAEAIAHASRVAAWAQALAGTAAVEAELTANGALIQALMATRGWADPQVKAAADRSAELITRLEPDHRHHVPTLWFLFTYHHVASNRRPARAIADQLVAVATRSPDLGLLAAAVMLRGLALFIDGDHAGARPLLERAIALYDPDRHRDHAARFGLDTLVMAKSFMAHIRWFSGDGAAAFALVAEAIAWARALGHVPSIALGLLYGCTIQQRAGDRGAVLAMATEILALSAKYGLPAYEGYAATLTAWATDDDQRIRAIVSGLTELGCKLALSYYGSLAADGQARRGELDAAIACIDHCLSLCAEYDEHFYEPELYRRRAMYEVQKDPRSEAARIALERASRLAQRNAMPRVEALATLDLLRRFGGGAPHRTRLDELLTLHPGLRALEADCHPGGFDEHGSIDDVSHDLPALDRGGVGQLRLP